MIKNMKTGNTKGHKGSYSMNPSDSGIINDFRKGNSSGSGTTTVKGNFPSGSMSDKSVKGLAIKRGRGWVNLVK